MSSSVRSRIVDLWVTRAAAISGVGSVVEMGEAEPDFGGQVAAIEFVAGDDALVSSTSTIEQFSFGMNVLLHLNDSVSKADADAMIQALYGTYAGPTLEVFSDSGQNLARSCRCTVYQGGPFRSDLGTKTFFHSFDIQYGFAIGDPTAPR